jgi:hypothetical protein
MSRIVRVWLPSAIALAGLVLLVAGDETMRGAGVVLIGSSLMVVLANLFLRLGLSSERDREHEESARDFFARHGRWPDD